MEAFLYYAKLVTDIYPLYDTRFKPKKVVWTKADRRKVLIKALSQSDYKEKMILKYRLKNNRQK